jgi:hypothetical protein
LRSDGGKIEAAILSTLGRLDQNAAADPERDVSCFAKLRNTAQHEVGSFGGLDRNYSLISNDGSLPDIEGAESIEQ